ncbi:MAG: glycoside hydrolase family 2, partial [Verrucomicrobia bacterium]|nr:glycoside hydrolase family 2 [Verrucomicrobiota bacterium]
MRGLTAVRAYNGAVWYQRDVVIPESWLGKYAELSLERCQWETYVWVDGKLQGTRNSLVAPHVYDLTRALTPGAHRLTVMVDNSNRNSGMEVGPDNMIKYLDLTTEVKKGAKLNCGGHHLWSYNWNGILGRMELRARDSVSFAEVNVHPDPGSTSAVVRAVIRNLTGAKGTLRLSAKWTARGDGTRAVASDAWGVELNGEREQRVERRVTAARPVQLWDEFTPQLYTLSVALSGASWADRRAVDFGMRQLGRKGTQITINGNPSFMRGTLEDFIFPLTGHPPVDVESWRKMIGIAKSYGLNFLRFHSCTPPDAAFTAADELGFYVQVEVPGTSCPSKDEAKSVEDFLSAELAAILRFYGNHPSFLFVSMGNEQLVAGKDNPFLARHQEVLARKVRYGQQTDPRHFYTSTTHPYRQDAPARIDDFYASAWPVVGTEPLCGIRWGGGRVIDTSRFNTRAPETMFDYGPSLQGLDRPLITHEVGQWAVYPDLREITRYHGAQRADNYEEIGERLKAKGLWAWSGDFTRASGLLALALYKEEIESALRTPGLGGFALLDIHDYPGQGTSTIGILNSLWESKGLTTPGAFRQFCAPVVLLARLPKRVWTRDETLAVRIDLANYGAGDCQGETLWSLQGADGRLYGQGKLERTAVARGQVGAVGTVACDLRAAAKADKLVLRVERPGVTANAWNLWVYPSTAPMDVPGGV